MKINLNKVDDLTTYDMDCTHGICGYTFAYLKEMMQNNNSVIITCNKESQNIYFFPKIHPRYKVLINRCIMENDYVYILKHNGTCEQLLTI